LQGGVAACTHVQTLAHSANAQPSQMLVRTSYECHAFDIIVRSNIATDARY
jgi:hypothetical protein